jgi:methylenetetrahydrofolate dehydrogenase (NADP+)/methenyltetrahydrofolate cyclohydrolase
MTLLDGKVVSAEIKNEIKEKVNSRKAKGLKAPHLAAVLVGENPASEAYVGNKIKSCHEVGFESSLVKRDETVSEEELLDIVNQLNTDPQVDGYIVQLPLPKHIDENKILLAIDPAKDVDGFHPVNVGKMMLGLPCFLPATPYGILKLLEYYKIPTEGKHCVVIGRSNIVGTPMTILMSRKNYPGNCTVTMAHSRTANLPEITKQADILIAAIGIAEFVKADMVKEGAVVIDVGMNRVDDPSRKSGSRLTGDVLFEEVAPKASYITPVPGGVGLLTVTALMLNTLQSLEIREQ